MPGGLPVRHPEAIRQFNDDGVLRSYRFDRMAAVVPTGDMPRSPLVDAVVSQAPAQRPSRSSAEGEAGIVEAVREGSLLGQLRNHGLIMSKGAAERRIREQVRNDLGRVDESAVRDRLLRLYPEDATGLSHVFTSEGGLLPDEAADLLGFQGDVSGLFAGLDRERGLTTETQRGLRTQRLALDEAEARQVQAEQVQGDRFRSARVNAQGEQVAARDLGEVGETVIVDGTEMTVLERGENGDVVIDGGSRFGVQELGPDDILPVESRGEPIDVAFSPGGQAQANAFRADDFFDGVVAFSPGVGSLNLPTANIPEGHSILPAGQVSRKDLQNAIVDSYQFEPARGRKPILTFLGGGGGAGKSTVRDLVGGIAGTVIDVDDVKSLIPEFHEKSLEERAAYVHEESSEIGKKLFDKALAAKGDFVKDGVMGNPNSAETQVKQAREAGFDVRLVAVTIDPQTAIERSLARARQLEETTGVGRHVPIEVLEEAHTSFNEALNTRYRTLFEPGEVQVFDNSGSGPVEISISDPVIEEHAQRARAKVQARKQAASREAAEAERRAAKEAADAERREVNRREAALQALLDRNQVGSIEALQALRQKMREERRFDESDRIRDELSAIGVESGDASL